MHQFSVDYFENYTNKAGTKRIIAFVMNIRTSFIRKETELNIYKASMVSV